MEERVETALYQKYGPSPPILARERLAAEIQSSIRGAKREDLKQIISFCDMLKFHNCPYYFAQTAASSFLFYLLGLSPTNPLPPHYICPVCHRMEFIFDDSTIDGCDLSPRRCTCGALMEVDGHNLKGEYYLADERLMGLVMIPVNRYAEIVSLAMELYKPNEQPVEPYAPDQFAVFPSVALATDTELPSYCENWFNPLSIGSTKQFILRNLRSLLPIEDHGKNQNTRRVLQSMCTRIETFFSAIRYVSLMRFCWKEDVDITAFLDSVPLPDGILFREDVFDHYIGLGVTAEVAYRQMNRLKRGRQETISLNTQEHLRFIEKARVYASMPSKVWAIEYLLSMAKKGLYT